MPGWEEKSSGRGMSNSHCCLMSQGRPGDKGLQNTVTDDDVKSQRAAQGNSDLSVLLVMSRRCQDNPDGARIPSAVTKGINTSSLLSEKVIYKVENRKSMACIRGHILYFCFPSCFRRSMKE
jgi:hypothetical protein